MKKIICWLTVLCLTAIAPRLAFGGAWTLAENNIWIEQYMKGNWATEDFGPDNDLHLKNNGAKSWGWSMSPKVEYGLTNWLTLRGELEYKEAKYKEYIRPPEWGPYVRKSHAVSAVKPAVKMRLLEKPVVLSTQVTGSIYPYKTAKEPGLSDGDYSLEFRSLVGKKFDTSIPFYLGAESGYRFRNRSVCNDIPFFVEGGFWARNWLLIKSEIDGYWSHNGTGNLEKEYAIWRIGPVFQLLGSGDKSVTKVGKSFNIEAQYGITFWGKNTSADQEVILKVSAQY